MGSRLAEPSCCHERSTREAMQRPSTYLADPLIDRLLQQRMGELVAHVPAVLRFGYEPGTDKRLEHRSEPLRRKTGDRGEGHAPRHCG